MANLTPTAGWDNVPQLETTTLATGGAGGPMNTQAQALLNRTEKLNAEKATTAYVDTGVASAKAYTDSGVAAALAYADAKAAAATPADASVTDAKVAANAAIKSGKLDFTRADTGAVSTTVLEKLSQTVSVFDFFTAAQIADVRSRAATLDVRTAIQAAFNAVKANGGRLVFPPGRYKITGYIGTTLWDANSTCDNTELHFLPGAELYLAPDYAVPSGTWFWHAISMEGNNVSVTGSLKLRSNQTLYWNKDLPSQRTNYLMGVIIGGKSYGHITPAIGQEREGVLVQGVDASDFHCCIVAQQARRVKILHNKTANDTDTAILVDNCLDDVEVAHNRCINSGDDHFFARHYANSPWAAAGWYVGDYRVHHNHFENNFAKFIGFGGIADVNCHDNYGYNCWWSGINVEIDNTWYDNSKRIKIHDNILRDCGRAWDPAHPNATYRTPVSDPTVTVGVLLTTSAASWPLKRFEHVEIYDNTIINPQSCAISAITAFDVKIHGNKCIAGIVTKNGTNYASTGAGVYIQDVNTVSIEGNSFLPNSGGTAFPYCYQINGDTNTQRVRIINNGVEWYSGALFVPYSAAIESQLSYVGNGIYSKVNWVPGTIPADGGTYTFSCPGARFGDLVQCSYSKILSGMSMTAYVNSNDVIAVRFENRTGAGVPLASGDLRFRCTRMGL